MGGQSYVYEFEYVLVNKLSTRGGWVVKKGQKSVYVVIECPLSNMIRKEGKAFTKKILHTKRLIHLGTKQIFLLLLGQCSTWNCK